VNDLFPISVQVVILLTVSRHLSSYVDLRYVPFEE
jgi:hypothetical protein